MVNYFDVNSYSYAGSSFAIPGLLKQVLASRNTRFDVDEVFNFLNVIVQIVKFFSSS